MNFDNLAIEDFIIDPGHLDLAGRWITPPIATPDTPVIVMLHEGLGAISLWKDFPQKLAQRTGHKILLYDRQGYGQSPPLTQVRQPDYNHRYALDELPAVLDYCKLTKPILFGHSDGGSIALIFAANHPTTALITEAAHIFVEDVTLQGIKDAEKMWHTTNLGQRLQKYHGTKTEETFFAWATTWQRREFRDWNLMAELPKIICPALVMQGIDDEYGSPKQIHEIEKHIAGPCKSLLVPDCQHVPHFQAEDTILENTQKFLSNLG